MDLPLPSVPISLFGFDDLWGRNLCFGLHESRPAHLDALSLEVVSWPLLRTITSHIVLRRVREEGKTQKIRILDGDRSAEILISGKQQVFRSETGKLDFCLFFCL